MKNLEFIERSILDLDPYIIAEIGVNHENSFETAIKIIDLAKKGGADAVKFQSYKADKLASKNSPSYWDTSKEPTLNQNELFKKYDSFNAEEYIKLFEYCKKINITFLSTPFDLESVNYLSPLVPFFKIASADITNFQLLKEVAAKEKPVLISTGASNIDEINEALQFLEQNGCNKIGLMHCILNYPTENSNANLSMISSLQKNFPNNIIGYSDHTVPEENMTTLITASLLGARVIEKHFTHDKQLPGNDHYHAMDIDDLIKFKDGINKIKTLLGEFTEKKAIPSEEMARLNARRSVVTTRKILSGEKIAIDDITCKRPGTGVTANNLQKIIGRQVKIDLEEDHILQWSDLVE